MGYFYLYKPRACIHRHLSMPPSCWDQRLLRLWATDRHTELDTHVQSHWLWLSDPTWLTAIVIWFLVAVSSLVRQLRCQGIRIGPIDSFRDQIIKILTSITAIVFSSFIAVSLHPANLKIELWVVFCSKWCSAQSGVLLNLGGVLLKVVFCSESGVLVNIHS